MPRPSLSSPSRRRSPAHRPPGRRHGLAVSALTAAALLLPGALPASAAETTATSSADAYTTSSAPDRNVGSVSKVAVGNDGWADKIGYLRFEIPEDATVITELRLAVSGGNPGALTIHRAGSGWDESSLSWANAPRPGAQLTEVDVSGHQQELRIPLSADVTSAGGEVTLALVREGGGVTRVASREAGANAPTIVVRHEDETPAPNPDPAPAPAPAPAPDPEPAGPGDESCTVSEILVPSCGAWFGVSANPLGSESWDAAMLDFENTIQRPVDIAHYYHRGQSTMFPTGSQLRRQNQAGSERILFFNWLPTGLTWRQVANGAADDYLRRLGDHMAANADKPFFLSLNAEPEGEVNQSSGSGQTARDYRDFFRHTIQLLRSRGADNLISVMNYTGTANWGDQPWFEDLYPGDDVVDWIAQDPYAFGNSPKWASDFAGMVGRTGYGDSSWPGFYEWAARNHPDKPQMLAEWGVDDVDYDRTYKPAFFRDAEDQLEDHPKIRALVYWNHSGRNRSGERILVGSTRVDSSPASLEAARDFFNSQTLTAPREAYFGD